MARAYRRPGRPTPTETGWRPRCKTAFAEGRVTKPELDERLTAAYAAGTVAELATITRDLRAAPVHPGAAPTSTRDVGIIAGFVRTGRWMVGRSFRGLAVIGNGEIDLRQAQFIDGETTIRATAVIGNITVVVPEDADVHIGGTGIMGGFDHHGEGPGTPGAPRITVTGVAFCGYVDVERRPAHAGLPSREEKRVKRRLERQRRQLERRQSR